MVEEPRKDVDGLLEGSYQRLCVAGSIDQSPLHVASPVGGLNIVGHFPWWLAPAG